MRRSAKRLCILWTVCLLGCSSENDVLGANAGWVIEYDDDNQPVCQLKMTGGGKTFGVAYTSGQFSMFFHRDTWNAQDGRIELQFYLENTVNFDGSVREGLPLDSQIANNVIVAPIGGFSRVLVRPFFVGLETHMIIDFPGTEENWEIYYGPARALSAFAATWNTSRASISGSLTWPTCRRPSW